MRKKYYFCTPQFPKAQVAEYVDAHVSGACAARRAGSIPVLGTKLWKKELIISSFFFV